MKNLKILWLLLVMSACSSSSDSDKPADNTPPPGGAGVQITVDDANRVNAIVPPTGGTVAATGQDGTVYEVTFPAGAVAAETQVSIAPVSSIVGTAYDENIVAALDLRPDGLQLDVPVELLITPAAPLAVDEVALGLQMASTGEDLEFWPAQVAGNAYGVEIGHFSVGGLGRMTEEEWFPYVLNQILDKYYGPFGLVETLKAVTSCSDYRLLVFEQLAADIMRVVSAVEAEPPEFVLDPPLQCTGYLDDIPDYCGSVFDLDDAARENVRIALEYFTRQATDECLAGDAAREAEAAACLERAAFWSETIPEVDLDPLCAIKAECGIATLLIEPDVLEIAVGESGQLVSVARDAAGTEIAGRAMLWQEYQTEIARLSAVDVANPYVTGVSPGKTSPQVSDEMTARTTCPAFSFDSATVYVTNEFVTDAQSVIVPEGETVDIQVRLAYPPEIGVEANVTVTGDPDITVASGETLTFKPEDWDQWQTVLLYAYEDDDDTANGTALLTITDTRVIGGLEGTKVATREIPLQEADNDAPSMVISPERLCVEKARTADLSVIGNQFVDLAAIEWASSDESVATVNPNGLVSAASAGPVRITASMVRDGQLVTAAHATLDVRESCAKIVAPNSPARTCLHAADNPAFEPVDKAVPVEAAVATPQDGYTVSWLPADGPQLSVSRTGDLTATVVAKAGGAASVELVVDNVITEYRATLPVDIVSLPGGYHGVRLNFPFEPGIWPGLLANRELIPTQALTDALTEAVARCGVGSEYMFDRMTVNNWHESGKVIGEYRPDYSINTEGFLFDAEECTLDFFVAPIRTPPGEFSSSKAFPQSVNADGTVVGHAWWEVYDNWCELDTDWDCTYHVNTAFVYKNGVIDYPFLDPNLRPYDPTQYNPGSGLYSLTDDRHALVWSSETDIQGIFNLDAPFVPGNPEILNVAGDGVLDIHGHVAGSYVNPWFYGGGTYVGLSPSFSGTTAPPYLYPARMNGAEDILAHSLDQNNARHWNLLYLCPLPVESPNAGYLDSLEVLEGYEAKESRCDGRDNDLDGLVDNGLDAPLTTKQAGVCAGARKTCEGPDGWEDDYSGITGYEFPEQSCDGQDNDCDGDRDEHCPTP